MPSGSSSAEQGPRRTILVVDDMAIFREPIAAVLREHGFQTVTADDGTAALSAIRTSRPDLIILDIAMPEMNGLDMLRRMSADPQTRDIPVILLTAVSDRDQIVRAARMGVQDYILKSSFNLEELVARVRRRLQEKAAGISAPLTLSAPSPGKSTPVHSAVAGDSPVSTSATAAEGIKDLKPLLTRRQVSQRLQKCQELKAFSPAISQIIQVTGQPACSLEHVANLIRQDQVVALKILKLANSAVYTRGAPVESVLKAVGRIGLAQIRQAVLNISVIETFAAGGVSEDLSSSQFWEHAIACGLISAELVHSRGGTAEDADTAFTVGLLHDVGRMVLAQELGDVYREVMQNAAALQLPLEQVESRMLEVNHAEVMQQVLAAWRFPKHLIGPVATHHLSAKNMRQLAPQAVQPMATLALANCLAHALLLGNSGNLSIYPTAELAASLKVDAAVIARIVEKIPEQTQDIKLAMLSKASDAGWTPMARQVREQMGFPLRAVCVSGSPQTDALAILARVLSEPDAGQPPNLAIVHITEAQEGESLATGLKDAEAAAQTTGLPLLLVSPTGTLGLTEGVTAGRRVEKLARPFVVARFVSAVKSLVEPDAHAAAA